MKLFDEIFGNVMKIMQWRPVEGSKLFQLSNFEISDHVETISATER